MTKLQDMYWSKHKWPSTSARWKLQTFDNAYNYLFDGLPKYSKDETFKFDQHTNEWVIACLGSFIAYALDFCMIADPDNRDNYYEWRKKYKSSLPPKQTVPLHFAYVYFNIPMKMKYGIDKYKETVKFMGGKYRLKKRPKHTTNDVPSAGKRWGGYFEDLSKSIKKVTQYSGKMRKNYQWKKPFRRGNDDSINKIYANYVVVLIMEAQEWLTRFQAGEFIDHDWKPTLNKINTPIGMKKDASGKWKRYTVIRE